MTVAATLGRLRDLGVTLLADAGVLRLRPASAVPPDLLAEVRTRKADLLALLAANDAVGHSEGDPPQGREPEFPPPASDIVETLAKVIATKPGVTVNGSAGMDYCRSEARRRWETKDPLVPAMLAAARLRPSSWPGATAMPSSGCRCASCGGRRWWRERKAAQGWRCETCCPAASLPDTDVEGVAT